MSLDSIKPFKFYLAGSFEDRGRLIEFKNSLEKLGNLCVSNWLYEQGPRQWDHEQPNHALKDLDEIDMCDVFILDTKTETRTGGREVELGYAWAKGKKCRIIGPNRNIFHSLVNREARNDVA